MKTKGKRLLAAAMLIVLTLALPASAADDEPALRARRETLMVRYELWYDYHLGPTRKNPTYRDFNVVNGCEKVSEKKIGSVTLTPLDLLFYEKAELWEVECRFW